MQRRVISILNKVMVLAVVVTTFFCQHFLAYADPLPLTIEQEAWLNEHKNEKIIIGLDPNAGIEFFKSGDGYKGYMIEIVDHLSKRLNLDIQIEYTKSWGEVYSDLHNGNIELLFGANPTPERLETMVFSAPIHSVPYTIMTRQAGGVKTIGDLHGKRVGFIEHDIAQDLFERSYDKIEYQTAIYKDQNDALQALVFNEIDGFVTSGGEVVYDYVYRYANVKSMVQLESIRSELTVSALKENHLLIEVIQMALLKDRAVIDEMIERAKQAYVRKLIKLTPEEEAWLESNPIIRVGVATDYLPVDYFDQGSYSGIAGYYFMNVVNLIGIRVEPVAANFDKIYQMALKGEIDVLNMAKTEEREANFIFTKPFSNERDKIYGRQSLPYIYDTYGLEGKRVAVIEGFWHEQYLERNLKNVEIVKTKDIQGALRLLMTNKADYFIETPAVAQYYIGGLGYSDIIEKGETSADSFFYFGAQKDKREFVSIFNKVRTLVSYEEAKYYGVQHLPQVENVANKQLMGLLLMAALLVIALMALVSGITRKLSKQSSEMMLLKERERLIYLDSLTGLYNRSYFNHIEPQMDQYEFPQFLIMLDLNDLKVVNDQYGHLVGDLLIQKFAEILVTIDRNATAIRMGGDEFVLWLKGTTEQEIQGLIQRLRFKCQQTVLEALTLDHAKMNNSHKSASQILNLSVAVGYSVRNSAIKTVEVSLQEADASMYADKAHMKTKGKV